MYEAILEEAQRQPEPPDFVLLTGDLAFSGTESEYQMLADRLVEPLRKALPSCPLFMVPGNHDVDRDEVGKPRLWITDAEEQAAFELVDAKGRRKREGALLPRFRAYRAFEREYGAWGDDWIASERGAALKLLQIRGQTVAVIGINTAWLAQDDHDWGQLTAGVTMVDAVLRDARAANPEITLVLGHHPLEAMAGERAWSGGHRIQTRLRQANAIYLHGHLHASGGQQTGDSMKSVLAIQAPSAFQAADSKVWRNGVLWGEADLAGARLIVMPKKWNDNHCEYVFDSDAAEGRLRLQGRDAYAFPLPGRGEATPNPSASAGAPLGWEIIDSAALAERTASRPSSNEMRDWFDGQFATWETALAPGVRPRRVVEDQIRRFEAARKSAPRPQVVLLTGAGGEGKSTSLLQVTGGLLRCGQAWSCLWRKAAAAGSVEDAIANLEHRPDHAWIVAIDDAENIGASLPDALKRIEPRTDVHMVLAARDADWTVRTLTDAMWQGIADFRRVVLAGLDREDARRITDGWFAYGDEALGRLQGSTAEQAAEALLASAREQSAQTGDGALLGALLMTREGEDLKDRVSRLMAPWASAQGVGGGSLLDVYALIAAMHAENQLYLSRAVLAFTLGCGEDELERGPLRVLRREAMVDSSETYVLTRHRRIAEAARDWLASMNYDVDSCYPRLAAGALRHYKRQRATLRDITRWRVELPRHFLDRGPSRWRVATAVAKALFEADPSDPMRLTVYASTLRKSAQASQALKLFREAGPAFRKHRDVLYEWAVAAGEAGDAGLDAWLVGRSLADDPAMPFRPNNIKMALAGLGYAFRTLFKATGRALFAEARAACGRLGLGLKELDNEAVQHFQDHVGSLPAPKSEPTIEADIALLSHAVREGSYEAIPSNDDPPIFAELLSEPEEYRYTMLAAELRRAASPKGSRGGR